MVLNRCTLSLVTPVRLTVGPQISTVFECVTPVPTLNRDHSVPKEYDLFWERLTRDSRKDHDFKHLLKTLKHYDLSMDLDGSSSSFNGWEQNSYSSNPSVGESRTENDLEQLDSLLIKISIISKR